jgi:hypothetical protein
VPGSRRYLRRDAHQRRVLVGQGGGHVVASGPDGLVDSGYVVIDTVHLFLHSVVAASGVTWRVPPDGGVHFGAGSTCNSMVLMVVLRALFVDVAGMRTDPEHPAGLT